MQQLDYFNAARVNGIMRGTYDPRLQQQPLVWSNRIPSVPADDDEIMARFIGFPLIADMIADDAKAVTYSFGKFQFESYKIPKLKVGVAMNEVMVKQLNRVNQNVATRDDVGVFQSWERRAINAGRFGVDMRREALLISMLFDGLTYDRLGIKLTNASWGMYSDLKITTGVTWDTAATATPVADIFAAKLLGKARYGVNYNRITMSTTAFRYMIATTEFQNKARMTLAPNVSYANLTLTDLDFQLRIASNVLGMQIEFDDRRYWTQDTVGVTTSTPVWPVPGVVLSDSTLDNNSDIWNFANGVITEGIVAAAVGGGPNIPQGFGPTSYATLADQSFNPPGLIYWCCQRGFPRKNFLGANSALTVGTFGDLVSTATPF